MSSTKGITRHDFLKVSVGTLASMVTWPWLSAGAPGADSTAQSLALAQTPAGADALPSGPRPWPAEARTYVEDVQEREYRRVAGVLDLGSDPRAAYQRLSRRAVANGITVQALKENLGAELAFTPEEWEQIGKDVLRLQERYLSAAPPTRYEDQSRYAVVSLMFDRMQDALADEGRAIAPRPLLATLPSGNVNANALTVPFTNISVIFFEQGLFQFLYDFAMVAGWAIPPLTRQQLTSDRELRNIPSSPYTMLYQASEFATASLYAYSVAGTPLATPEPPARPAHNLLLAYMMLQQMQRFALAHELGHLALGHLGAQPSMQDEYDADGFALRLACDLARRDFGSWAVGYWAADLMLVALNCFYRALTRLAFGNREVKWISVTHPDPLARRDALQDTKLVPNAPVSGVRAAIGLRAMTDAIFPRLLSISLLALDEHYNSGARTSPMWNDLIAKTFTVA